jgi:hypothetical protein|tara:strand:+ start:2511 stop:2747 length:237 start_codon:yes stop_codon:yes gene_type:complete
MNIAYMKTSKHDKNFTITDIELLDDEDKKASEVIIDGVVRPVITSRKIEKTKTPIKSFTPFSASSKDNWLESFAHKES